MEFNLSQVSHTSNTYFPRIGPTICYPGVLHTYLNTWCATRHFLGMFRQYLKFLWMQILLSLLTPDSAESWPFFMAYSWPFSFPILIRFSAHGHSHLYCCLIITILHFGGGCDQSSGRNRAAKCWPRHAHIWQDRPNNEAIWVFIHLSEFNKVWRAIGYRMKIAFL